MPSEAAHRSAEGVVTLTTDFGLQDPFVGIMKGVIARIAPGINVIDVSHDVPAYRPEIGGLWLGLSYRWFARGAVHVAVVDPGVGTARRIVCIQANDHMFVAPDNGLAAEISRHVGGWSAHIVDPTSLGLLIPSTTFHGRDIFAPVAAGLASGELSIEQLGPPIRDLEPSSLPRAAMAADEIRGEIILADHFGNLMSNICGPAPDDWESPLAHVGDRALRLVRAYDEARRDELVVIFNSFGLLEIACPRGNASDASGWRPGQEIRLQAGR